MRWWIVILIGLLMPTAWGDIRVPAENLADEDEGTVQFWMKLDNVGDLGAGFHGLGRPFSWVDKDAGGRMAGLDISVFQKNGQTSIRIGMGDDKLYASPLLINLSRPTDVWHQVAVTWREGKVTAYLDGKRQDDRELKQPWEMTPSRAEIRFGAAQMLVDDLCISSVAKTEAQLQETLRPSASTLLLLNFDSAPVMAVAGLVIPALDGMIKVEGRDLSAGDFNSVK